jgi:hypothetical protein
MADVRVTCITKPNTDSKHEHITHLGNPSQGWKWTREQVIKSIEKKDNTFFVLDPFNGKRADIGVRYPTDGRVPYVQTYADKDWNNNLLSLNQCPIN